MRYVFAAAVALAFVFRPAPAHAVLHVIHALVDAHKAKHDSCFEKLRHHHVMKKAHKHGCGGGCSTCN